MASSGSTSIEGGGDDDDDDGILLDVDHAAAEESSDEEAPDRAAHQGKYRQTSSVIAEFCHIRPPADATMTF